MHLKKIVSNVVFFYGLFFNAYAGTSGTIGNNNESGFFISGFLNYNFFDFKNAETASFFSPAAINAPESSIGDKLGYNLGLGYRVNPFLRVSFMTQILPNVAFSVSDDGPETATGHIDTYTYMINGYATLPLQINEKIEPYLMGGIGAANSKTTNIYFPLAVQTEFGRSTTQLAWQIGVGSIFRITEHIDLDINYSFLNIGNTTNSGQYDAIASNGTPPYGAPTQLNRVYANQIAAGAHYRFG